MTETKYVHARKIVNSYTYLETLIEKLELKKKKVKEEEELN